jgi:hypothetical protein
MRRNNTSLLSSHHSLDRLIEILIIEVDHQKRLMNLRRICNGDAIDFNERFPALCLFDLVYELGEGYQLSQR